MMWWCDDEDDEDDGDDEDDEDDGDEDGVLVIFYDYFHCYWLCYEKNERKWKNGVRVMSEKRGSNVAVLCEEKSKLMNSKKWEEEKTSFLWRGCRCSFLIELLEVNICRVVDWGFPRNVKSVNRQNYEQRKIRGKQPRKQEVWISWNIWILNRINKKGWVCVFM